MDSGLGSDEDRRTRTKEQKQLLNQQLLSGCFIDAASLSDEAEVVVSTDQRRNEERRQGALVFQSNIPQFSMLQMTTADGQCSGDDHSLNSLDITAAGGSSSTASSYQETSTPYNSIVHLNFDEHHENSTGGAAAGGGRKTPLGFYVDLKDVGAEAPKTPPSSASILGTKKNIFSMVIDFEAPKKDKPIQLSSSLVQFKRSKPKAHKLGGNKRNGGLFHLGVQSSNNCSSNSLSSSVSSVCSSVAGPSSLHSRPLLDEEICSSSNGSSSKQSDDSKDELTTNEIGRFILNENGHQNADSSTLNLDLDSDNLLSLEKFSRSSKSSSSSENVSLEKSMESKQQHLNNVIVDDDGSTNMIRNARQGGDVVEPNSLLTLNDNDDQDNDDDNNGRASNSDKDVTEQQNSSTASMMTETEIEMEHQNGGPNKRNDFRNDVDRPQQQHFVKLSDLECQKPRLDLMNNFSTARMSKSIPRPENNSSWVESPLVLLQNMSRSAGYRSAPHPIVANETDTSSSEGHNIAGSSGDSTRGSANNGGLEATTDDASTGGSSTTSRVNNGNSGNASEQQRSRPRRSVQQRLGTDLLRMFLEEIGPDVVVDVEGHKIKAHKCILASRCQYFAALLSGNWLEKTSNNEISLQGFSQESVYFALCHIYSGAAHVPDSISLVELASLADMLGLEGLKEVVEHALEQRHCHDFHRPCAGCCTGVLEVLPLSAAYGLDDLYQKCLQWITRHFVRVWPSRSFAQLPRELREKCYQQHVVHMTPDKVLDTMMNCDRILVTLPALRWAEPVSQLTLQLFDACQLYQRQHYVQVLSSPSFLALTLSDPHANQIEEHMLLAVNSLSIEQSCRSYARCCKLVEQPQPHSNNSSGGGTSTSRYMSDLLRNIKGLLEKHLVSNSDKLIRSSAWLKLDSTLRCRIKDLTPIAEPVSRLPRATSKKKTILSPLSQSAKLHSVGSPANTISSSDSSRNSSPSVNHHNSLLNHHPHTTNQSHRLLHNNSQNSGGSPSLRRSLLMAARAPQQQQQQQQQTVANNVTMVTTSTAVPVPPSPSTHRRSGSTLTRPTQSSAAKSALSKNIKQAVGGGGVAKHASNTTHHRQQLQNHHVQAKVNSNLHTTSTTKSGNNAVTKQPPTSAARKTTTYGRSSSDNVAISPRSTANYWKTSAKTKQQTATTTTTSYSAPTSKKPSISSRSSSPLKTDRLSSPRRADSSRITSPVKSDRSSVKSDRGTPSPKKLDRVMSPRNNRKVVAGAEEVLEVDKPAPSMVRSSTFLKDEPTVLGKVMQ